MGYPNSQYHNINTSKILSAFCTAMSIMFTLFKKEIKLTHVRYFAEFIPCKNCDQFLHNNLR